METKREQLERDQTRHRKSINQPGLEVHRLGPVLHLERDVRLIRSIGTGAQPGCDAVGAGMATRQKDPHHG